MVKHNNIIPNAHFRKDWQRFVRTWFDQPAQKERRRVAREARAKRIAPRPLEKLRPAVRGQTVKYNRKVREGRGFTKAEVKAAGLSAKAAQSFGISIDKRRRNSSEESFKLNVKRIQQYKSKLVVFPRNGKKEKKGDTPVAQRGTAHAAGLAPVLPIKNVQPRFVARKITKEESSANVHATLRKTLLHQKLWGRREKRAKDKADAAKAPKREALDDGAAEE